MNLTEKLNAIVEECIRDHVGGEAFFTAFDSKVKDVLFIEQLLQLSHEWPYIIVSGKFGMFVSNYFETINPEYRGEKICLIVNGNLRKGDPVVDLSPFRNRIHGKHYVFLDDSFYSGKTKNAIQKALESSGGSLLHTYVVYDGSKMRDRSVTSLYRYYDKFS